MAKSRHRKPRNLPKVVQVWKWKTWGIDPVPNCRAHVLSHFACPPGHLPGHHTPICSFPLHHLHSLPLTGLLYPCWCLLFYTVVSHKWFIEQMSLYLTGYSSHMYCFHEHLIVYYCLSLPNSGKEFGTLASEKPKVRAHCHHLIAIWLWLLEHVRAWVSSYIKYRLKITLPHRFIEKSGWDHLYIQITLQCFCHVINIHYSVVLAAIMAVVIVAV